MMTQSGHLTFSQECPVLSASLRPLFSNRIIRFVEKALIFCNSLSLVLPMPGRSNLFGSRLHGCVQLPTRLSVITCYDPDIRSVVLTGAHAGGFHKSCWGPAVVWLVAARAAG